MTIDPAITALPIIAGITAAAGAEASPTLPGFAALIAPVDLPSDGMVPGMTVPDAIAPSPVPVAAAISTAQLVTAEEHAATPPAETLPAPLAPVHEQADKPQRMAQVALPDHQSDKAGQVMAGPPRGITPNNPDMPDIAQVAASVKTAKAASAQMSGDSASGSDDDGRDDKAAPDAGMPALALAVPLASSSVPPAKATGTKDAAAGKVDAHPSLHPLSIETPAGKEGGRADAATQMPAAPASPANPRIAAPIDQPAMKKQPQEAPSPGAPIPSAPTVSLPTEISRQPAPPVTSVSVRPGQFSEDLAVAIVRHAGQAPDHRSETLTLRLDPPEHGRIEVRLLFDDSTPLRASVSATNPATLDMLKRESGDLFRALGQAGISADAQSFQFGGHAQGGGGQQRSTTPFPYHSRLPAQEAAEEAAIVTITAEPLSHGLRRRSIDLIT